ncbi:MAG: right-handed parallel beta-helix repeat-containing protein [Deltaproteobacteria bacterium]|nr:right-handed parallel beta-helix repeat-containing protein [Deltaproteobacteria bacterium]
MVRGWVRQLYRLRGVGLLIFLSTSFIYSATAQALIRYVDCQSGSDTNDCSNNTTKVCRSISRAVMQAGLGDTVQIAPGLCSITATINPNTKNLIIQGSGLRGENQTLIEASSNLAQLFLFNKPQINNTTVLRQLVLKAKAGHALVVNGNASPIIENNIIIGDDNRSGYRGIYGWGSKDLVIRNNIILESYWGILGDDNANNIIANNTVVNAKGDAFSYGNRRNNLAYNNYDNGFDDCAATFPSTYNTSFANDDNFDDTDCSSDSTNNTNDPLFNVLTAGLSSGLTATTLSFAGADWADNQWQGYFVTPNANRPGGAQYFYIMGNNQNTLTVRSNNSMLEVWEGTAFGTLGAAFVITDFAIHSNSPVAGTGTLTGLPSLDVYGNTRGAADRGAVKASDSVLELNRRLQVDALLGIDDGDCVAVACASLRYAMAMAKSGDIVWLKGGVHDVGPAPLGFAGRLITVRADRVRGDGMAIVQARPNQKQVFHLRGSEIDQRLVIKNLVVQANGGSGLFIENLASPLIDGNVVLADDDATSFYGIYSGNSTQGLLQNNIILNSRIGIYGSQNTTNLIRNNTVLNSISYAFYRGRQLNNLTVASNGTNDNPQFKVLASRISTEISATTLTDATQTWTPDQWKGFFLIADTGDAKPHYFFIRGNTVNKLNVLSDNSLTSFAVVGNTYQILDLTPRSITIVDQGDDSNAPTYDIYGTERPQGEGVDRGAVEWVAPPEVSIDDVTLNEGDSNSTTAQFTITLSHVYPLPISIGYQTEAGTAQAGIDYEETAAVVEIAAGSTQASLTVTIKGDTLYEPDEAFGLRLTTATQDANIVDDLGVATLQNDDRPPQVYFSKASQSHWEGSATLNIPVELNNPSALPVTVSVTVSGTAQGAGIDYSVLSDTVTILAGETKGTFLINIIDDAVDEPDETILLTLENPLQASLGSQTNYRVTLVDNDETPKPRVTLPKQITLDAGKTVKLRAEVSGVAPFNYQWVVKRGGCGTLTPDTPATSAVFAAGQEFCKDTLTLLVTDSQGNTAAASTEITVMLANPKQGFLENPFVSNAHGTPIYISHTTADDGTKVTQLKVGEVSIAVECQDYNVEVSQQDYLAIVDPCANTVYLSSVPWTELKGNLTLREPVSSHVAKEENLQTPSSLSLANESIGFHQIRALNPTDELGKYLISGDVDGDGISEFLMTAPGAGEHGFAYIYNNHAQLIGLIEGSEAYPIYSLFLVSLVPGEPPQLLLGPDNLAMNPQLTFVSSADPFTSVETVPLLEAGRAWVMGERFSSEEIEHTINLGGQVQALAQGDLNGDGKIDLVLSLNNGWVYGFLGPLTADYNFTAANASFVFDHESSACFGQALAMGDVTGDGFDDLMVGAPCEQDDVGVIYVFYGSSSFAADISNAKQLVGETEQAQIGSDFLLMDQNTDGAQEIYTMTSTGEVVYFSLNETASPSDPSPSGEGGDTNGFAGSGCQLQPTAFHGLPWGGWALFLLFLLLGRIFLPKISASA